MSFKWDASDTVTSTIHAILTSSNTTLTWRFLTFYIKVSHIGKEFMALVNSFAIAILLAFLIEL